MHLSGRLVASGKESRICCELACSSSCYHLDTTPLHWKAPPLWRFDDQFQLFLPMWFCIQCLMWDGILVFHDPCIERTFCYFNSRDFQQNITKWIPYKTEILETVFSVLWYLRFSWEWELIFFFAFLACDSINLLFLYQGSFLCIQCVCVCVCVYYWQF